MCVAVYKPAKAGFPSKKTLRTCFENNPDGAGYMYNDGAQVVIQKGFMSFSAFWRHLQRDRLTHGNECAYVMHFRISTQAGTRPDCTHPFPLSENMSDLRQLKTTAKIGIAHNGIINLTSTYARGITHSDTMEFITDYLALIIRKREYYKDQCTLKLIERLAGSRLAILDHTGHCELIGNGWHQSDYDECFYSNTSYQARKYTYSNITTAPATQLKTPYSAFSLFDDYIYTPDGAIDEQSEISAYYEQFLNKDTGLYEFDGFDCPATASGDCSYCDMCANQGACYSY